MDIQKKEKQWKERARRFHERATFSKGEFHKRTDKVKGDEAKAIVQAHRDLDGDTKAVAAIFGRDRRVISSVLAKTELASLITGYEGLRKEQQKSEQLVNLREFILQWKSELPLPLNYLDIEDLSEGQGWTGRGRTAKRTYIPGDPVIRIFPIEDYDEFRLIRRFMARSKVWRAFGDCKRLGGAIIQRCSTLIKDIRQQSEAATAMRIVDIGEVGLDWCFAWTIYAEALNIFTKEWECNIYHSDGERNDLRLVRWGDYNLAIVKTCAADDVTSAHQELRTKCKSSWLVKRILGLKRELDQAETQVCKELDAIEQALALRP